MKKNFAIVGCGRIGNRHATQIARVGNVKAVCDIIPERANILALQHNAVAYYNIDKLLANEPILDLLSICTPNGLHALHSIKAMEAGINVLCEKPLCIHTSDAKAMIATAEKNGTKLFVVKQNRYNPPIEYLKNLISAGSLGKVYSFQLNCFWNRPIAYYTDWKGRLDMDGGTLYTQFSHFIDLIYWLLGDVENVTAVQKNLAHPSIEFEDTGMVLFEMKSGALGSMNYSVNSFEKNMEGSLTILAERGTVKIGGEYLNELEYFKVAGMTTPVLPRGNEANGYGFYQGSMSNHDKVYDNVIAALDGANQTMASALDGLKTVEIIEKIYLSGRALKQ